MRTHGHLSLISMLYSVPIALPTVKVTSVLQEIPKSCHPLLRRPVSTAQTPHDSYRSTWQRSDPELQAMKNQTIAHKSDRSVAFSMAALQPLPHVIQHVC